MIVIFFRAGFFYPVDQPDHLCSPEDFAEHARCNPGTLKIESADGKLLWKATEPLPRICETCNRDTQAPLFDGCMNNPCPRGYEPCL